MIQKIKNCKELIPYLKDFIEDEGIRVEIDSSIDKRELAIIKVDEYYNGLHLARPPKSIDYAVVVDCECKSYALYLLELKNVKSPKGLRIEDIQQKFQVTIEDFLSIRFRNIFMADEYKYKNIKLYLVSDPYELVGKYSTYIEYKKVREKIQKKDSLRVDMNLNSKLYRFRGKILKINYDIPPNPIIRKTS